MLIRVAGGGTGRGTDSTVVGTWRLGAREGLAL